MRKLEPLILADLATNGPSTPLDIAKRLGVSKTSEVWRHVVRLARSGEITFDDTGRIARLA